MKKIITILILLISAKCFSQNHFMEKNIFDGDTNVFVKRAGYTYNIHGTLSQFSFITKKYVDSIIAAASSSQTMQQTFNAGSILTKIDSFYLNHTTGIHIGARTNGYFQFKDDSTSSNPRTVKFSTTLTDNPVKITAIGNVVGVSPVEQLMIHNPATSGSTAQAMIAFRVHDGSQDSTIGWAGLTSGSYTAGGTGVGTKVTYLENSGTGGVALLANNSAAKIQLYVGAYDQASNVKLEVKNDTIKHNVGLVYQNYGGNIITRSDGTNGGSHYFNTFSTGIPTGVTINKAVNASSASNSFVPLGFDVPTTGNVGQVIAAASNYSSTVNVPANGFGILANSDDLSFIAGVSGKGIRFTDGGYTSANQTMTIKSQKVGIKTITPTSSLEVAGSFAKKYTATATGITLDDTHSTVDVTATGQTITLPTSVGVTGRIYTIKLTASGSGTVATTSSQTIDGSTTYSLASQYKYVTVQSNGANWIVIANN